MAISINVIEILNDTYQLSALPLGEPIKVRLTAMPDMSTIDKYISIVNVDSSEDVPNFSSYPFLIQDEFEYKRIECDYEIQAQQDNTYVLTVSPLDILKPESIFYLAVHKNLAPLSYTITKQTSLGPSFIRCLVKDTGISEDTGYTITITSQSNLQNGAHIIEFSVTQDEGSQVSFTRNIKEDNVFPLNAAHSVVFNSDIPYLTGETFYIALSAFNRLGTTKTQKFSTIVESTVIENPETTSTRLSQQQIIEFYENTQWGQEFVPTTQPVVENAINATFQFIHPNKIRILFDKEILISSITDQFLNIDISHAFGNYLLPNMGLYDDAAKYIFRYRIVNKTESTTQRIDITIDKDTNNSVPEDQIYILQAAV